MARKLFSEPEVVDLTGIDEKIKFGKPDIEGFRKFMIEEKGFNETRIENVVKRLESAKNKASQTRLDNFFGFGVKKKEENEDEKAGTVRKEKPSTMKSGKKLTKKKGKKTK